MRARIGYTNGVSFVVTLFRSMAANLCVHLGRIWAKSDYSFFYRIVEWALVNSGNSAKRNSTLLCNSKQLILFYIKMKTKIDENCTMHIDRTEIVTAGNGAERSVKLATIMSQWSNHECVQSYWFSTFQLEFLKTKIWEFVMKVRDWIISHWPLSHNAVRSLSVVR